MFKSAGLIIAIAAVSPTSAEPPKDDKLAIILQQDGYVCIQLRKLPTGHEAMQAEINGVTGTFVVDSGASGTVVNEASRDRLALVARDNAQGRDGVGAGGKLTTKDYNIQSLVIGGSSFPIPTVKVMDIGGVVSAIRAKVGVDIDGVIGQDVLTKYSGIIDVAQSRLFLKRRNIRSDQKN